MGLIAKDDGWRVSDELWSKMEELLPKSKPHPLWCHRPRVPNRQAMNAILFVLRTGTQRNSLDAVNSGRKRPHPHPPFSVQFTPRDNRRDGNMFLFFGLPPVQGVDRSRSV